jgi:hypothetical protein
MRSGFVLSGLRGQYLELLIILAECALEFSIAGKRRTTADRWQEQGIIKGLIICTALCMPIRQVHIFVFSKSGFENSNRNVYKSKRLA